MQHEDRRVHLAPKPLIDAWDAWAASLGEERPADELLLIGRREQRTNNSWMHNVPAMVAGRERCLLYVHPEDAAARGLADGERVVMESRVYRGEVRIRVTDEMAPGVESLPHGWGHAPAARWQRVAGRTPGVSINDWTDETLVEDVVGQSVLNGVPVRLYPREPLEQRVAS